MANFVVSRARFFFATVSAPVPTKRHWADFPPMTQRIGKMNASNQRMAVRGEALFDEAYERVKTDLAAVKEEDLLQVNLDVTAAVTSVLGLLPEVRALRAQMEGLPAFDMAAFDKLEDYALALSYSNTGYLAATQPPGDLPELNAEASRLHDRLLADIEALVQHGLLDGGQLAQLKGGNGYKNLAQDLQLLSRVMREGWEKIENKSATTADDLKAANQMSVRLMRIVGLREQGPALLAAATDQRQRAFTVFMNVYEDVRRAVSFLRGRRGDADTIAPSLYPGRPRRRPAEDEPTEPSVGTAEASSPTEASSADPGATSPGTAARDLAARASKDPFLR
jgi:hypothetical protein